MIRFIDIGNQIVGARPPVREFAFYDTITCQFIEFFGAQTWETISEFLGDYHNHDGEKYPVDRFTNLIPKDWAFE